MPINLIHFLKKKKVGNQNNHKQQCEQMSEPQNYKHVHKKKEKKREEEKTHA